jgi:L-2,4-diaminobutyric acid acetyltransferase
MKKENIKIRSITENDKEAIIKLIDCCRPYVLPHHEYLYWILGHYYKSSCLVCETDKELIGFISGLPSIDEKTIFIWQICVHPDYRKHKVGSKLLNKTYERLVELNFTSLQFSIDTENVPSYKLFENFAIENNLIIEVVSNEKICSSDEIAYKI